MSAVDFNNITTTTTITNSYNSSSIGNGLNNTSNSSDVAQYNGKIIVITLALLLCVILLIMAVHIYAKRLWSRSLRRREAVLWRRRPETASMSQPSEALGLDPAIINSLPTFTYKVPSPESKDGPLECAVCLSEFQDNDNGRLLPKCNHRFHVTCIDMWFMSHTTCPLCRTNVLTTEVHSTQLEVELGTIRHVSGAARYVSQQVNSSDMFQQLPQPYADARNDGNNNHTNNSDMSTIQQYALPSPGWLWQRSTSERFTQAAPIGVQFPTNVLFWGDNAHVNTHTNSLQLQSDGHRPLHHTTSSEELVSRDDARVSTLTSRFVSMGSQSAQTPHLSQQPGKPPGAPLSAFKRLLSRERKIFPTQQDMASSSTSSNV